MEVGNRPDIFQENRSEIFEESDTVYACIYNILITDINEFLGYLKEINKVL